MPITFVDIDAWQRVRQRRLEQWELKAIKKADRAYLDQWNESQPKPTA